MKPAVHSYSADINVTPFLDVLLVLIIIFLTATNVRKTIDTQLPEPCTGFCHSTDVPIVLEVASDGSFRLNQRPLLAQELLPTLHSVFDLRPDKTIWVAGHSDASYQRVLTAMDVARAAGVKVISVSPGQTIAQR